MQMQQLAYNSGKNPINNGINVVTTKKGSIASQQGPNVNVAAGFNKAAKSVSQSKPPAHAQYFNSAKMKNEGSMMGGGGPANNMQHASNAG